MREIKTFKDPRLIDIVCIVSFTFASLFIVTIHTHNYKRDAIGFSSARVKFRKLLYNHFANLLTSLIEMFIESVLQCRRRTLLSVRTA